MHAPIVDRRAQHGLVRQHVRAQPECAEVAGKVSDSRPRTVPEVLEQQ